MKGASLEGIAAAWTETPVSTAFAPRPRPFHPGKPLRWHDQDAAGRRLPPGPVPQRRVIASLSRLA
nr:hypothetical protein [Candidatus Sigynarchaeota archaeon]